MVVRPDRFVFAACADGGELEQPCESVERVAE